MRQRLSRTPVLVCCEAFSILAGCEERTGVQCLRSRTVADDKKKWLSFPTMADEIPTVLTEHYLLPIDLSKTSCHQPFRRGNVPAMSKQQVPPSASKRGLSLDLNSSVPSGSKRARLASSALGGAAAPPVLTTPDVQMLKLSSPELAKFLSSGTGATPTPSGNIFFTKSPTKEQELYVQPFEEALMNMHKSNQRQPPASSTTTAVTTAVTANATAISTIERATAAHRNSLAIAASAIADQPPLPVDNDSAAVSPRPSSGASGSLDSNELPEGVTVKQESLLDEDSRDGSTLNPIDMETQEKIKLERKRQRNRVAASKCRKRKLERISQLDEKVQQLKGENGELAGVVKKLKEAVCNLKQEVMEHVNNGCTIMLTDMSPL